MAVITFSRQFGSKGDEIASQVCQAMGYRMFDKYMVLEAARVSGISQEDIVDYSEENHRVRGFLDRLFGGAMAASYAGVWPVDPSTMRTIKDIRLREEESLQLVRKSIWSAFKAGNMVIVGRAGQMILKDCPGVVHFRVIAPLEDRIQSVKEMLKRDNPGLMNEFDLRREAQDLIIERDEASADYLRQYYNANIEDPLLYHLVVNTGLIKPEAAVTLITRSAAEL